MPHVPIRIYVFFLQKSAEHLTPFYQNKKRQNRDHVPDFENNGKHGFNYNITPSPLPLSIKFYAEGWMRSRRGEVYF